MNGHWTFYLLHIVAWLIVMPLIMRWLARSRLRDHPATDALPIRQPPTMLAIALIGSLLPVGILIAASIWPEGLTPYVIAALFMLLNLYVLADYFLARHCVDEQGMAYGRIFGRRGRFDWSDVTQVGFNEWMNWYRIRLASGATVRVSGMLLRLPMFAAHILAHVPAHRIDATTHEMLQEAANCKLHRLGLW